jgi:hypothetical protein
MFDKNVIYEDVTHSLEEIRSTTKPSYTIDPPPKFKGSVLEDSSKFLQKNINLSGKGIYEIIGKTALIISDNGDDILNTIKKDFSTQQLKSTMDYYSLNLLKYFEALNSFNGYTRIWLSAVSWQTLESQVPEFKESSRPPTIRLDINSAVNFNTMLDFANMVNILAMSFDKYLRSIDHLKGHVFQDGDWVGGGTAAFTSKLDPHRTGFVNVNYNPVYHIGLAIDAWRISKHELNVSEYQRIQLVLIATSDDLKESSDPERIKKLKQKMEYFTNEANVLHGKIEKFENS